jgi:hypothetical protein
MKNNKGFAPILIILIVVGVLTLGGGTYYFLVKKAPKAVGCTQEAKICPDGSSVGRTGPNCEFAECPTVKEEDIASWSIYKNEKYGYEIKYPKKLEVEVLPGEEATPINDVSAIGIGFPVNASSMEEMARMPRNVIMIMVMDNFKDLSVNQFSSNSDIGMVCETKKEKEITTLVCKIDESVIIRDSVFEKGGLFYEVLFNTMLVGDRKEWDFSENISIYNQILSSFKFLD